MGDGRGRSVIHTDFSVWKVERRKPHITEDQLF